MKKEILVIDPDIEVYKHIRNALENEIINVSHVHNTEEGLLLMRLNNYSLIIMDVALSEQSGCEVLTVMRELQPMPILILSGSASTHDRVAALNYGADDFLAKPYELEECLAKAQALLRRYTELNHIAERGYAVVSHNKLLLDIARRTVMVEGEEVELSKKEFDVLYYLLKHRNRVLTYEQIYEAVWKDVYMEDKSAIAFQIKQLRQKLGDPEMIKTVYGVGFRINNNSE